MLQIPHAFLMSSEAKQNKDLYFLREFSNFVMLLSNDMNFVFFSHPFAQLWRYRAKNSSG